MAKKLDSIAIILCELMESSNSLLMVVITGAGTSGAIFAISERAAEASGWTGPSSRTIAV
jgi:hypothetical protein